MTEMTVTLIGGPADGQVCRGIQPNHTTIAKGLPQGTATYDARTGEYLSWRPREDA